VVENPLEIRAEVGDHTKLEDLPKESEGPSIESELEEFVQRKKKEVEETQKMLDIGKMEKKKKEKLSKLDEEMKKMKGKGPTPFG
jgi:hypothetical protein